MVYGNKNQSISNAEEMEKNCQFLWLLQMGKEGRVFQLFFFLLRSDNEEIHSFMISVWIQTQ